MNPSRYRTLIYTRKLPAVLFGYHIENVTFERMDIIKDLHIYFDSNLTFSKHISTKLNYAMKAYGYIVNKCKDLSDTKTRIWRDYLESILQILQNSQWKSSTTFFKISILYWYYLLYDLRKSPKVARSFHSKYLHSIGEIVFNM